MNTDGWLKGLQVTADGTGIVSHAGIALIRALADDTGLTAGLSKALASRRLLVHDRGRVLAEVIRDFGVIGYQEDLFREGSQIRKHPPLTSAHYRSHDPALTLDVS